MTFKIIKMKDEHLNDVYNFWNNCEGIGLSDADSEKNLRLYLWHNPDLSLLAVANDKIVGAVLSGQRSTRIV